MPGLNNTLPIFFTFWRLHQKLVVNMQAQTRDRKAQKINKEKRKKLIATTSKSIKREIMNIITIGID